MPCAISYMMRLHGVYSALLRYGSVIHSRSQQFASIFHTASQSDNIETTAQYAMKVLSPSLVQMDKVSAAASI